MKIFALVLISSVLIGCVAPSRLGVRYKGENIVNTSDKLTNNPNIVISVNPLTGEDIPYDIDVLRNMFESNIHKNPDLEELIKKYPDLKINMDVTPSEEIRRMWILDVLFFYPGLGFLLPYTPWWGNVKLDSKLTISVPNRISSDFEFNATEPFEIESYPYYRAGKILSNKYSIAYNHLFAKLSTYNFSEFGDKADKISPNVAVVPQDSINTTGKSRTLTTVYARSYFQARFMNLFATISGAVLPMVVGVKGELTNFITKDDLELAKSTMVATNYIAAQTTRKNSSDFEMKLGDFDVSSYFNSSFYSLKSEIKDYNIESISDTIDHSKIIKRTLTQNIKTDSQFTAELNNANYKCISALKFQYGIGPRAGSEQFGFTKKYRPYVRVVGLIKDVNTNKFLWSNNIIIFSNLVYLGQKAAQEADVPELIKEFKVISDKLVRIIIDDLNGKKYTYKEYLVDYDPQNDDAL